ncbi:bacillithiol biosynthesis deacetylase BshB1 [Bacillus sp. FJAT-49732]|uniref:Bacillithiol biosynthesis deacetylase BshB1 n=1 Tax=Lederbergia citrisecunda TaxID=2833583 RepID=A0A942YJL8_9BACI|nr:bacillithiol biosynthesis deacetylase BshB1 [Lederbergia citrisecunda]MBS4199488.1 bacillithiol biosynthesis deacetylase BshB1 [Lederbergia citrisecunda]
MNHHTVDILAFGAHADDVEIGMAGSLAKWSAEGKKIVICDLTEAELSSNGNVETRKKEAKTAADIMGAVDRVNLCLADRGLFLTDDHIRKIANVIRKYKPKVIFAPYHNDRHPDHGNCFRLVQEAFFSAGIRKFEVEGDYPPHKASYLYQYMINGFASPHFVVDTSDFIDKKVNALQSYESQFYIPDGGVQTPLTEGYIETVTARDKLFGKEVGVKYAEGFLSSKPLLLNHNLFGEGL